MPKMKRSMTPRQCEIAAESYAACLLAQSGYDVFVQYGARQQDSDLVATKGKKSVRISVKGSQDGGWMLAVRYLKKGVNYIAAIMSGRVGSLTTLFICSSGFVGYRFTRLRMST